jgi:DNA adenine methylase
MKTPHPMPYQGSKRALASQIGRYIPADTARIVEPFCGSAAVSMYALTRHHATSAWLNDLNTALVDLWKEIVLFPDKIAAGYEALWNKQAGQESAFYVKVREEFNRSPSPEKFLYLLARCVKASVRYNSNGEFNQSPDNRRKGAMPLTMKDNIQGASEVFRGKVEFSSLHYAEALKNVKTTDLVYMDPPYQGVSGKRDARYASGINHEEYAEALGELNRRQIRYMVSYDGRTGNKSFGKPLPKSLNLVHLELEAGPSTQATLLGRQEATVEALYLSPALAVALNINPAKLKTPQEYPALFEVAS